MSNIQYQRLSTNQRVWLTAAIFFGICLTLQWWRMQSLTASMDQGILYQVLWNGLRGHPFESTLSSQLSTNVIHNGEFPAIGYHRLGQHFTPVLALWIPLIAVLGKWGLPFLQVTLITSAGIILYELGKERLTKELSAMIAFAFFGANAVIGPCLGNFTDLSQLPLFIFALILGIERRVNWLIVIFGILIPLIREDAGVLLVGIGLWLIVRKQKEWVLGAIFILYGGLWAIAVTNVFMPLFSADSSKRFMVENFGQYIMGKDEATSIDVIQLGIQQPLMILNELINPFGKTLRYLCGHGLPLVLIPFISIDCWLLMGLPLLGLLLAQGNPLAINWRYTYLVVPGLFSGSIYWWENHFNIFKIRHFRRVWTGCIILSLIFTLTSNPNRTLSWMMPQSINPWIYMSPIKQFKHGQIALNALKIIPNSGTVSASSSLIPHVAGREVVVRFPDNTNYQDSQGNVLETDWIAVDLDHHQKYAHAFKNEWEDLQEIIYLLRRLEDRYNPVFVKDGIIILKLSNDINSDLNSSYQKVVTKASNIRFK